MLYIQQFNVVISVEPSFYLSGLPSLFGVQLCFTLFARHAQLMCEGFI